MSSQTFHKLLKYLCIPRDELLYFTEEMPDTLQKKKIVSKRKLLRTSWRHQTRVFFENSTLHGVRYIAEEDRPVYEK